MVLNDKPIGVNMCCCNHFKDTTMFIFEMQHFLYFTFFQILAQYCGIYHPIKTCFGTIRLVMKLPNFSIITSLSCHSPLVNYGINKLLVTAATGWTSLGIMTYPQGRASDSIFTDNNLSKKCP